MEHNKSKRIEVFHHPAVNGCWWWTMDDQQRWLWQQLLQSVVPVRLLPSSTRKWRCMYATSPPRR